MDLANAKGISRLLKKAGGVPRSEFKLEKYIGKKTLAGFHQWADARSCEGAFLFKDSAGYGLWLLLIDWRESGNFYLVIFPESRSGPIAEIHKLRTGPDGEILEWRYSPHKQDDKNGERKDYFAEVFLSEHVQISVPTETEDLDAFLSELFALARARLKADELDPDRPSPREGFPEGKLKERLHLARERNPELVRKAKLAALLRDGCLKCACCRFDFHIAYGKVGKGFIEAHHTKPLSTLHKDGEETKIEDLALVCSNCHRMLHRRRPWLKPDQLSQLLTANLGLQGTQASGAALAGLRL